MSWFGEGFNNITGQISNFTKEVLTEGTEEVDDHATELRVAKARIREVEAQCSNQFTEIGRLKHKNKELQENVESAELQINRLSSEYRERLENKEAEIKRLKQTQHDLQQSVVSSVIPPDFPSSPTLSHSTSTSQLSSSFLQNSAFHSDNADFSDIIASQREINRLNHEVQRLQAESLHWRHLVQNTGSDTQSGSSRDEVTQLQTEIKELQEKVHQEVDEHQRELAALQDIHSQKLSTLKRNHKQQTSEYEDRIIELEEHIASTQSVHSEAESNQIRTEQRSQSDLSKVQQLTRKNEKFEAELGKVQHELREKTRELSILGHQLETLQAEKIQLAQNNEQLSKTKQAFDRQISYLKASVETLTSDKNAAIKEAQEHRLENEQQGSDSTKLQEKLERAEKRIEELTKTEAKKSELKSNVQTLETERKLVAMETNEMVSEMGSVEHQQLTADIVNSMEEESNILKQHSAELQQTVDELQKSLMSMSAEKQKAEQTVHDMSVQLQQLRGLKRSDSEKTLEHLGDSETESNIDVPRPRIVTSTPFQRPKADSNASETSSRSGLLPLEQEMSFDEFETESMVSGFSEISARNRMLDDQVHILQGQIEAYERDIEQYEMVKSDWQVEKEALEDVLLKLRGELKEKEIQLNVAQAEQGLSKAQKQTKEKTRAKQGLIELEKHGRETAIESDTESESDIESGVHDLCRKVELLTQANCQLENERDSLAKQKKKVEQELSNVKQDYAILEASVIDGSGVNAEQLDIPAQQMDDLKTKLKQRDQELQEINMERDSLVSSLEELDAQHHEAITHIISKRDQLLVQNSDLDKELENQKKQLNSSVDEISNLTSERQNLVDEISNLKSRLNNGALALNELHMDKGEKEKEMSKLKEQLRNAKDSEAKEKMEKQHIQINIEDLNTKLEQAKKKMFELQESSLNDSVQRDWEHKIEQLEQELTTRTTSVTTYENNVRELQLQIQQLELRVKDTNDEKLKLSTTLEKMEKEYSVEVETLNAKYQNYIKECETQIDALKSEKQSFEKELDQSEMKLTEKTKYYKNYIKEITHARELNDSSLQSKHEKLLSDTHEKDGNISALKTECEERQMEVEEMKEMLQSTIDGQKPLTDLISERETEIANLKSENTSINQENEVLQHNLQELRASLQRLQDVEKQLHSAREENRKLYSDLERLRSQQDSETIDTRTLDVITDLESEITTLNETLYEKETEILQLTEIIQERDAGITHLNEEKAENILKLNQSKETLERYGITIAGLEQQLSIKETDKFELKQQILSSKLNDRNVINRRDGGSDAKSSSYIESDIDQSIHEKDQYISKLETSVREKSLFTETLQRQIGELQSQNRQELEKLSKHCETLKQEINCKEQDIELLSDKLDTSEHNLEQKSNELRDTLEKLEKSVLHSPSRRHISEAMQGGSADFTDAGEMNVEKDSVSDEIKEMRKIIRDKDEIISELRDNNAALLNMLDSKSLSVYGDNTLTELHRLQNVEKLLQMEKEQIMSVLNEKTRECSSLKNEVHRLMNVVSAEKAALSKLQQDNQELLNKISNTPNTEMTKEAVQKLSRLIREKDLEIESLHDRNKSLLEVLQKTSNPGSPTLGQHTDSTQVASLLQEREHFRKQLNSYQTEREQFTALINQKHQESQMYYGEINRLSACLQDEIHKFETLQQQFTQLSQQFEKNKQTLVNTQSELLLFRNKCADFQTHLDSLAEKEKSGAPVPKSEFDSKCLEVEEMKEKLHKQKQALLEKDNVVGDMLQQLNQKDNTIQSKESENNSLRKQLESLTFQLQGLETELQDLQSDQQTWANKSTEQDSESIMLKEINSKMTLSVREKDFEINALKEKVQTLSQMLQDRVGGEKIEVDRLVRESEAMQKQAQQFQQERDQVLLALQQRQVDNSYLVQQNESLSGQVQKLTKELARLREHLIQIEEGYTREALEAEAREKGLRNRLAVAEEKALSSSTAVESVNLQASQQLDNLQTQLHQIASQRDQAVLQLQASQEQTQQYAHSLNNLQMVLEQFQVEKEAEKTAENERYQKQLNNYHEECIELKKQVADLKNELVEQSDALEAAQRLSEELDRKEDTISALKQEVHIRESQLKEAEDKIHTLNTSTEAKVDKLVIKNLFIGYFSAPSRKQIDVLRLIGSVLNFSHEELQKIGAESGGSGWLGSLWRKSAPTPPTSPARGLPDKSFSELFVNFLEKESTPKPKFKLPVDDMVKEEQQKHHQQRPAFNPFSAPKHASLPVQLGEVQSHGESHLLMSALPTFSAAPVLSASEPGQGSGPSSRSSTPSGGAILKNVLQQ